MDNPVLWSAVLLGVAVILFFMELLVPSGAMGFIAAVCAIGGIVLLFQVNTTVGLIGAIVSLAGLPFILFCVMRLWPNTPMARMLLLRNPVAQPDGGHGAGATGSEPTSIEVGMTGKAISDLRPVGICLINAQRLDCLAEGGVIRADTEVRVTAVDGMQIKVRPQEEI